MRNRTSLGFSLLNFFFNPQSGSLLLLYLFVVVYIVNQTHLTSVQSLSHVWLFATPWTAAHQASLSISNSQSLLKLMSIELVMPSNHLILCLPLLLPPSIFPIIWVFSNESVLRIRWPKYWSFSFNISPSSESSGLISFRMGWLDLLAVQGTLKSLLQHHSSKASILQRSAFFLLQLSHPYMTTGKTIALTRRTFVGKVMSLFSNMLICSLKTSIKVFLNPHRPGEGEDIELGKGQQAKSWADWASFRHHNVPGDSLSTRRLAESLMGVKGNLGLFQYKVS